MNRNQTVTAIVGMLVGLAAGAGLIQLQINQETNQRADDLCWVQGGTYKDGTCTKPEYEMSYKEKVCVAMKGSYTITENKTTGEEEVTCYSPQGKEIELPDLGGKKVVIIDGETVLLDAA